MTTDTNTTRPASARGPGRASAPGLATVDLLEISSLVLWVMCLVVGALGLWLGFAMPLRQKPPSVPVAVQMASVEITNDPLAVAGPSEEATPQPQTATPSAPPPAPSVASADAAPALESLVEPSPRVAFATPTTRAGAAASAPSAGSGRKATGGNGDVSGAATGGVQHLTYGQGQGRQPAPTYPREAMAARQQGTVIVQFDVDDDGRVTEARLLKASPWPLLNQEAVRTVRDRWRFASGMPRTFDVSIRFVLN